MEVKHLRAGTMKVEIHASQKLAGEAAARCAAQAFSDLDTAGNGLGVIFATGASQLDTLHALTSMPGLPWRKVHGFHLDEYIGIDENHPASFRRYLRENLTTRVPMGEFFEIDGTSADLDGMRQEYAEKASRRKSAALSAWHW